MRQKSRLEYIYHPEQGFSDPNDQSKNTLSTRLKIFAAVFLTSLAIGLAYNYARAPIYQTKATVLTSPSATIDQASGDADLQRASIEQEKLLGFDLLNETLQQIQSSSNNPDWSKLTLSKIRSLLSLEAVEGTHLLHLYATGDDPELLPLVANTLIDLYVSKHTVTVETSTQDTYQMVSDELANLDQQVTDARTELEDFRNKNDISSLSETENALPATIKNLNKSYDEANSEFLKAKAKLDAIDLAIANGQTVVPNQEQKMLTELEKRYQQLSEQLNEFDQRYTRDYLALQPSLKYLPEQIKELEIEIKSKRRQGEKIVRSLALREYQAAQQVVNKIQQQLNNHRNNAVKFTNLFAQHEALAADLESLEILRREVQDRFAKLSSKNYSKIPQVNIVERASLNKQAIGPDYQSGALITLIVCLLLALFVVWMNDYLTAHPEQNQSEPIHVSPLYEKNVIGARIDEAKIEQAVEVENGELPAPDQTPKSLSSAHLEQILDNAESGAQLTSLLLLSGMTLEEIANLGLEQINISEATIEVPGHFKRLIPIGPNLLGILTAAVKNGYLWHNQANPSKEMLNAMLFCTAVDAGISLSSKSPAAAIRETYIIYLVEQGIRLALLNQAVGYLSPVELTKYAQFSPETEGLSIQQIELLYPLC